MFDREKWGEVFQSIGKNKMRTVLTGFAVFWGIFMLIILLGLGSGLQNGFSQGFANTATNSISIWGGETSKPWNGLPANREIQLDEDDVVALRNSIPGLEHISGSYRVWRGASQVQYGKNYGSYDINGIVSENQLLQRQTVMEGRFINEVDEQEARKVIVIAEDARKELFKEEPYLNQWVNVNGVPFQVVGLYKFENAGEGGMMRRSPVFIPLSCAQKVFNANREIRQIMFSFADDSPQGAVMAEERARHTLARNHNFDPTDDRALWLENNVENVGTFNQVFGFIKLFIWAVGIGSLVAGIVGIGNIMLIVVKDRTREIGIRKAMGATPANVIGQIMLEALFVTILFGYFGLAIAVLILEGMALAIPGNPYFANPTIDFGTALYALAAMIAAGALAGYFPARRAAAIKPIEALRDE